MDRDSFQRIERLFDELVDLDADQRQRRLDRACAGDPDLRRRVEALLRESDRSVARIPGLIEETAREMERPDPLTGTRVGPFAIERLLGSGGFGSVYVAQQDEPVRRRVALKVIRPGMASDEVLARFEAERQTLARMDHPGIARVFDAGTLPDGRPYFTMECVDGQPIHTYCDERRLSLRKRLALFVEVTRAVQHAHQKGVLHRDLKPGNILVTDQDGSPRPIVIDFGIAKALEPIKDSVGLTGTLQLVGTPEYMSPEQADPRKRDVDTRSDVYSLGIVLYELLTGMTPFARGELERAGLEEVLRMLREVDPPRPSARLKESVDHGTGAAERRDTAAVSLNRSLRGDLDWIVMRALEKSPARRYDSVGALGDDVQRHLDDEPVTAGPPGRRYRLSKFVRRHRTAVIAGAVVVAALAVGLVAALIGQQRARAAEAGQRVEAETAQQVSEFLVQLFESPTPDRPGAGDVTARELLDRGARRIQHDLRDQPEVRARLMTLIGNVSMTIGDHDRARELIEAGLELRRAVYPAEHPAIADSLVAMGSVSYEQGQVEAARGYYRQALQMRLRLLPPNDPAVADAYHGLATVHRYFNELDEAEAAYREALRIYESHDGTSDGLVLDMRHGLADSLAGQQDGKDEAEALFRQVLDDCIAAYGEEHHCTAEAASSLASLLRSTGALEQARPFHELTMRLRQAINGADSELYAQSINNYAVFLNAQDLDEEALLYSRRAVETYERALGPSHPSTAFALIALSGILRNTGHVEACVDEAARAQEILKQAHGEDYWPGRLAQSTKGYCLCQLGRREEGERELIEAHRSLLATLGEEHRHTRQTAQRLEDVRAGKFD